MATRATVKTPTPPRRRKVNVETNEPTRPAYETAGERAFLANRAKNAATSVEKKELETCLIEMVNSKVDDFSITVTLPEGAGTAAVDFKIDRDDDIKPDIQELFKLVLAKEIAMEDFVSVCSTSQGAVKDKFGSLVLAKIMKPVPKESPKLKMKARR
jgi:hypothetical protein